MASTLSRHAVIPSSHHHLDPPGMHAPPPSSAETPQALRAAFTQFNEAYCDHMRASNGTTGDYAATARLRKVVDGINSACLSRNDEVIREILREVEALKKIPSVQPHLFDHLLVSVSRQALFSEDEARDHYERDPTDTTRPPRTRTAREVAPTAQVAAPRSNQALYYLNAASSPKAQNYLDEGKPPTDLRMSAEYIQANASAGSSPVIAPIRLHLPPSITPSSPQPLSPLYLPPTDALTSSARTPAPVSVPIPAPTPPSPAKVSLYIQPTAPSTPSPTPAKIMPTPLYLSSPRDGATPPSSSVPSSHPPAPNIQFLQGLSLMRLQDPPPIIVEPVPVPRDWSEEFWNALSMPFNSPEQSLLRSNTIKAVADAFVDAATHIGKVIITEAFGPPEARTIHPTDAGGVAGGLKFLRDGIFFKFAVDVFGLYGGDQYASKAAGHELKGLMAYFNCQIPGLLLPLMALIDYRGFRLIATSSLPIGEDTLVYGSMDGGVTVLNSDPALDTKMKEAAQILNLKGHMAGHRKGSSGEVEGTMVHAPCDVEGHAIQGRGHVIIDTARTFPPEKPFGAKPGMHLHNLLRPELVRSNGVPLSSDAFTSFGGADNTLHNKEVEQAQQRLLCEILPNFVLAINQRVKRMSQRMTFVQLADEISLTHNMHMEGINVRYLPALKRTDIHGLDPRLCTLINTEIVARKAKNRLRAYMRAKQALISSNTAHDRPSYNSADEAKGIVQFLNLTIVAACLQTCESIAGLGGGHVIIASAGGVSISLLIHRISQMTGIYLQPHALEKVEDGVLASEDLVEVLPKVKYIHTVPFQEGLALYYMSLRGLEPNPAADRSRDLRTSTNGTASQDTQDKRSDALLSIASEKFREALRAKPDDPQILTHWGILLLQRARLHTSMIAGLDKAAGEETFESNTGHHALLNSAEGSEGESDEEAQDGQTQGRLVNSGGAEGSRDDFVAKREKFFQDAVEKFENAVRIKRNHHYALYNWGDALRVWASTHEAGSPEHVRLQRMARSKLKEAGVFNKRWFFGTLPTNGAQGLLSHQPALSFFIRNSNGRPGHFVFSYLTRERKIKHSLINNTPNGQYTLHPPQPNGEGEAKAKAHDKGHDKLRVYPTLEDLVMGKIDEGWSPILKDWWR
eukprot:TRINITY_DN7684_c0_g1_i8.p1 TRINITY_DN7684_c0_g1~~TRINITY_DN7684_c0_g1_i8.p1  ORF type:complete len:1138 (-),score=347.00 TRINITY_DN7684_c0_g1_i8:32-3445(-)